MPLAFEAAVAGGIPVIKAVREGLAGNDHCAHRRDIERDVQLYPDADARRGAGIRRDFGRRAAAWLCGGGPVLRYRRGGCGAQAGDPGGAGVRAAGGVRRCACGGDTRGFGAGYRVCRRVGVSDQAAGDRAGIGRRRGGAGASVHGAGRGAAGAGGRGLQCGGGGRGFRRAADAGRARRRGGAYGVGGGRGPGGSGARAADAGVGRRRGRFPRRPRCRFPRMWGRIICG